MARLNSLASSKEDIIIAQPNSFNFGLNLSSTPTQSFVMPDLIF